MQDYLAQLKESQSENAKLVKRIESLIQEKDSCEADWNAKEQALMEGIAKMQEETKIKLDEKDKEI